MCRTAQFVRSVVASSLLAVALGTGSVATAAVEPGFNSRTFASNDDESLFVSCIGFSINFFGQTYNSLWINNNGNVTFDDALGEFTPFNLQTTNRVIIAPFFADVDTRGGTPVTYGSGAFGGQQTFGVNWTDVGYFNQQQGRLNSFQMLLVNRDDVAAGDFDIVFNYDEILWEAGSASGGDADGLGGDSARVGYSNGVSDSFELDGSAVNGALIDGGSNSLSSVGRFVFNVRNGAVIPIDPGVVPEPVSLFAWLGLAGCLGTTLGRRS